MPLVAPLLRLSLISLNVYETFKVLKVPKPSNRTGEPSKRALSQRKRNMKSCMTVWLVWFCYTLFERVFDRLFDAIIPFYREFQTLALLFQLITRYRGAEPIYLYVLRPSIKPYVSTLDYLLDVVHTTGDFVVLMLYMPVLVLLEWWRCSNVGSSITESEHESNRLANHYSELPKSSNKGIGSIQKVQGKIVSNGSISNAGGSIETTVGSPPVASRENGSLESSEKVPVLPETVSRISSISLRASRGRYGSISTHTSFQSRERLVSDPSPRHEIWYPPGTMKSTSSNSQLSVSRKPQKDNTSIQQTIKEDGPVTDFPLSLPDKIESSAIIAPLQTSDIGNIGDNTLTVEEWRVYPPFPSAYPLTPILARRSVSDNFQGAEKKMSPKPSMYSDSQAGHTISTLEQLDFGVSLERLREEKFEDSSSRSTSSDINNVSLNGSLQALKFFQNPRVEKHVSESPDGVFASVDDVEMNVPHLSYEAAVRAPVHTMTQSGNLRVTLPLDSSQRNSAFSPSLYSAINSESTALSTNSRSSSFQTVSSESLKSVPSDSSSIVLHKEFETESLEIPKLAGRKRTLPKVNVPSNKKRKVVDRIQRDSLPVKKGVVRQKAPKIRENVSDPVVANRHTEETMETADTGDVLDKSDTTEVKKASEYKRQRLAPTEKTNMPINYRRSTRSIAFKKADSMH